MKCLEIDYRKILNLYNEYLNKEEELREVVMTFKKLRCLTHKKYNKANYAIEAFNSKWELLNFPIHRKL